MFEHRQRFATVQLHGELGRQLREAFVGLQGEEDLRRQRPGVEQHLPIDPGRGAEHQVAHVIAGRLARAKPGGQQWLDQRVVPGTDPTDLQVGPVGRLDHAPGEPLGHRRHDFGLIRLDGTAIELDPTDPTVQRLDDTQQPRATGGAYDAGGWTFVQGKTDK